MHARIRRSSLTAMHADVDRVLPLLEIDENATYRQVFIVRSPGEEDVVTEQTASGADLRGQIGLFLQTMFNTVEQTDPNTINLSWPNATKRNDYRTNWGVFTKLP